jgi:hypothetical protein
MTMTSVSSNATTTHCPFSSVLIFQRVASELPCTFSAPWARYLCRTQPQNEKAPSGAAYSFRAEDAAPDGAKNQFGREFFYKYAAPTALLCAQ